jgi:hypothetical protein
MRHADQSGHIAERGDAKAANSAFYAHTARTSSLHEAIMRIGLTRLQSILMLTLLKSRVLKAGSLRAHAELLIDMLSRSPRWRAPFARERLAPRTCASCAAC